MKLFSASKVVLDEYTFADISVETKNVNVDIFQALLPEENKLISYKNEIFNYCNTLLEHRFDLLGSQLQNVKLNKSREDFVEFGINKANRIKSKEILDRIDSDYQLINWDIDFKSGFMWPSDIKSKLLIYGHREGVDVKIPWELGRLQHLIPLAYAAILDKSEQNIYLIEYKNQLLDFIGSNPISYGIQWKSSMDAAIRVVNIIFSFSIIKKKFETIDDIFEDILLKSIAGHSKFIYNNLEWNEGLRANHYFFNLAGILISQLFLSNEYSSKEEFTFSLNGVRKEIEYQFYNDGGNFEASIPYHYFVAEALFLCKKLLVESGIELAGDSDSLKKRIKGIEYFSSINCDSKKRISQIGDNDSGYLIKLFPEDIFNSDTLNVSHALRLINPVERQFGLFSFRDFGLYIKLKEDYRFTFRCGSVGQKGKGGHSHNDQLSFTFSYRGVDFLVDAGTFAYTSFPNERNKYRSTEYHNTLSFTGKEQNDFFQNNIDDLFWMYDKSKAVIAAISENHIKGVHFGFGNKVERDIHFLRDRINCIDFCESVDKKYIHFHLHPEINVESFDDYIKLSRDDITLNLQFRNAVHTISEYDYSPGYGIKIPSRKITLNSQETIIEWKLVFK